MRLRAAIATIALGATIGIGGTAVATSEVVTASQAAPAVSVAGTKKASCVIRFDHPDGKTPIMLGGSHACVGVESAVFNQHGDLELMLGVKDPNRWKINSLHIQVDEQLAGDVTVGGSGGTARLRIRFHTLDGDRLYLNKAADRAVIWGHQKNIWYSAEWLDAKTFTNGGQ